MTKERFSKREIIGGNYRIGFYFEKDERKFMLSISKNENCESIEVREQNDDECVFRACKSVDLDAYINLAKPLNNVLIEMYELTNNLMNSL